MNVPTSWLKVGNNMTVLSQPLIKIYQANCKIFCPSFMLHYLSCSIIFFDQVKYLGVWINASLKDDDDIQRQVKSPYCAANKLRGTFDQCSPAVKSLCFVPISSQCMLANYGANTRRPVWSAYVLHITMPIELCITYPEMLVSGHIVLLLCSKNMCTLCIHQA